MGRVKEEKARVGEGGKMAVRGWVRAKGKEAAVAVTQTRMQEVAAAVENEAGVMEREVGEVKPASAS